MNCGAMSLSVPIDNSGLTGPSPNSPYPHAHAAARVARGVDPGGFNPLKCHILCFKILVG